MFSNVAMHVLNSDSLMPRALPCLASWRDTVRMYDTRLITQTCRSTESKFSFDVLLCALGTACRKLCGASLDWLGVCINRFRGGKHDRFSVAIHWGFPCISVSLHSILGFFLSRSGFRRILLEKCQGDPVPTPTVSPRTLRSPARDSCFLDRARFVNTGYHGREKKVGDGMRTLTETLSCGAL